MQLFVHYFHIEAYPAHVQEVLDVYLRTFILHISSQINFSIHEVLKINHRNTGNMWSNMLDTSVKSAVKSFILEFTRTRLIWTPVACSGEFKYEVGTKLDRFTKLEVLCFCSTINILWWLYHNFFIQLIPSLLNFFTFFCFKLWADCARSSRGHFLRFVIFL